MMIVEEAGLCCKRGVQNRQQERERNACNWLGMMFVVQSEIQDAFDGTMWFCACSGILLAY